MNKKLVALLLAVMGLALPLAVLAGFNVPNMPNGTAINITVIFSKIFDIVWMVTAAVVVIIFITIGFMFLTSQGEPSKLELARRAVIWACVGVFVILISFSIIALIMMTFATGGGGGGGATGACCAPGGSGACSETTQAGCTGGGLFAPGGTCTPNPCS